jgi:hypothetical protein
MRSARIHSWEHSRRERVAARSARVSRVVQVTREEPRVRYRSIRRGTRRSPSRAAPVGDRVPPARASRPPPQPRPRRWPHRAPSQAQGLSQDNADPTDPGARRPVSANRQGQRRDRADLRHRHASAFPANRVVIDGQTPGGQQPPVAPSTSRPAADPGPPQDHRQGDRRRTRGRRNESVPPRPQAPTGRLDHQARHRAAAHQPPKPRGSAPPTRSTLGGRQRSSLPGDDSCSTPTAPVAETLGQDRRHLSGPRPNTVT